MHTAYVTSGRKQLAMKLYLSGSLVMAELAQEVDLLHKLPLIEPQVEDPAHQNPLSQISLAVPQ